MTTHTIINPATELPVRQVEQSTAEQTDLAIERASAAQKRWREVAPGDRARLLRRFAEIVDTHTDELAALETANSGHPVGAARWEAGQVRDVLMYYSAAPERPGRHVQGAGWCRGPDRAVELPDADLVLGARASARHRVRGGGQARRTDPADRDAHR
jgi:acyl-CoA reductase-like NAD-dependent aldehyde dehydrogenase